jgi:cell division protease FtsH
MNIFKNKFLWFFAIVLVIVPLQIHCETEFEALIRRNREVQNKKALAVDNTSYLEKVGKVVKGKVDYLKSQEGVDKTINSVIEGSSALLWLGATIAVMVYVQKIMMNNMVGDQVMQIYYPGQIKFKFADVAGLSGAKSDMQDIISYLKNPKKYKKVGAKVPKGILMNGGPGNGKTLLAKAVAGEVNVPFISINGSSFAQLFVGLGAARVRELFKKARDLASSYGGCIIFIDEIDSLALQRSSRGDNQEHDQTLNALLAEMDGLDASSSPVIVLGATNRVELIDEAVKRAGRFDRKVEVTKPRVKDRIELLKIALKMIKQSPFDIDIDHIALATGGFSGAEIANLINEAAILAANAGRDSVENEDIELAFDNITLGREIQGMDQSDEAKMKTAIHEAGHTMALVILDKKNIVHKSSITPRGNTLGVMRLLPLYESYSSTQDDMENEIVILLSGRLAEEEFGMGLSTGASNDLERSHSMAYNMVAKYGMSHALRNISYSQRGELPNDIATQVEREVQKIVDKCTEKGKKLIAKHRQDIEKIAKLMVQKGTILGEEIYNLLNLPVPSLTSVTPKRLQEAFIAG